MLQLSGEVREVKTSERTYEGETYSVVDVFVLSGKADIDRVRISRDFDGTIPREGERVTFAVEAGAFAGRNGAVSTLTATRSLTPAAQPSKAA